MVLLLLFGMVFCALWLTGVIIAWSSGNDRLALVALVIPPVGAGIAISKLKKEKQN